MQHRLGSGDMSDSSHNDDPGHFSVEHRVRRLGIHKAPETPSPPRRLIVRDLVLLGGAVVAALLVLVGNGVALTTNIILKLLPRHVR